MKRIKLILLVVGLFACGCGRPIPRDANGNPIFNSQPVLSVPLTNCIVDVYYYTISSNIENTGSAFFVAEKPTPEQVVKFATETPAFFFIIHSNQSVSTLVALEQHPRENRKQRYAFRIIREPRKPSTLVPLPYVQDIPDLRAYEMKHGTWDLKADLIMNGNETTLVFNGQKYSTLPLPILLKRLEELISEGTLYK